MTLPPYQLITTTIEWEKCLAKLQAETQVMIDLEANSMFAYRESICLIQISIPEVMVQTDDYLDHITNINLENNYQVGM